MATKLGVINNALIELGDRPLVDTGEAVDAGRIMNAAWDTVVADCLEAGEWNFGTATSSITGDTGISQAYGGFTYGFNKPTDWVRTIAISDDQYFSAPLTQYFDDTDFWYADSTPIYVRYISNDTGDGLFLARWPSSFRRFVEMELAARTAARFTTVTDREALEARRNKAKRDALAKDALNSAQPKFAPASSWTRARGGRTNRGDRGNRGSLTG